MAEIQSEKTKKPSFATPAAKTKAAQIEALLRRKTGARLVDLTKATVPATPDMVRYAMAALGLVIAALLVRGPGTNEWFQQRR